MGGHLQTLVCNGADPREREVWVPVRLVDVLVQLVQVVAKQLAHDEQVLLVRVRVRDRVRVRVRVRDRVRARVRRSSLK